MKAVAQGSATVRAVHGPRRIMIWSIAALALAGMVAAMVWAVGYVSSDRFLQDAIADIGLHLGAIDSVGSLVGGEDRTWWHGPAIVFGVMMAIEFAISLFVRTIPRRGHEWEMPDSELTPEELIERREIEAELDAMEEPQEPRRFGLKGSTWFYGGLFMLSVGLPLAADLAIARFMPSEDHLDPREGMARVVARCPALERDVAALLERRAPTVEDVSSMRARAKVISASPVRGQECGS